MSVKCNSMLKKFIENSHEEIYEKNGHERFDWKEWNDLDEFLVDMSEGGGK